MKQLAVVLAAVGLSAALAADPKTVEASQGTFVGAVNGALGDNIGAVMHIPGYGFHTQARAFGTPPTVEKAVSELKIVLPALAKTIRGLDRNDWVSVGYKTDEYHLVMRIKPAAASSLETWINGRKR